MTHVPDRETADDLCIPLLPCPPALAPDQLAEADAECARAIAAFARQFSRPRQPSGEV